MPKIQELIMAIIDISITEPQSIVENVVEIPSRYGDAPALVRTADYCGGRRYICPSCQHAVGRVDAREEYLRCKFLSRRHGDTRLCKVALNRRTCPLGYRNPE